MRVWATLAFAAVAAAQPRQPELFGHVGVFRVAGDESWLGTGAQFGGSAMLPVRSRLAVDLDWTHGRSSLNRPSFRSRVRRNFFNTSLLYRVGDERRYFFVGGGAGLQNDSRDIAVDFAGPGPRNFGESETGLSLNARMGVVARLKDRWLLRVEYFQVHYYVLPSFGARVGIGYRFGEPR